MPIPLQRALRTNDLILAVDDRPFSRRLLYSMLQMLNYQRIQFAATKDEALAALADQDAALLLLDWHLAATAPADVLDALRDAGQPRLTALPVLVLTGQANRQSVAELWQRGADGVVIKPCSVSVLERHMQLAVERRGRRVAESGPARDVDGTRSDGPRRKP